MPAKRISFTNFDRRLVLSGGREQTGQAAMRRASGIAPELTISVLSRWGSELLYNIAAIQTYYWNGARYQYDGANLYKNGSSIVSGFNGSRITFNSMPPQAGLNDYLFILGGGKTPFKISPTGTISNWGIVAPVNQLVATNVAQDQIVIDSFVNHHANYTTGNCTLADESTIVAVGAGSLNVNPGSTGAYDFYQNYASALNLAQYGNGDLSLNTDVFQMWIYIDSYPTNVSTATWLEIDFDVDDQTFKKNWYSCSIGLIPATAPNPRLPLHHNVNVTYVFQVGQWIQVTIPKSEFNRNGTEYQLDWSMVQAIRFKGGNFIGTGHIYLDNLTLSGGCAMGAGPAVGNGGSEYDYYTTYLNLTTGSESNGQQTPTKVFNVQDNKVSLTNVPISPDAQVTARNLYRSSAQVLAGAVFPAYYLDTIWDNSTTTYTDNTADFSVPLVQTPWVANIVVQPSDPTNPSTANYYIDAGNGYYFLLTTPGTTGIQPPAWVIPTTQWSPFSIFLLNETVAPLKANGQFWIVTTPGTSGVIQPNWAASPAVGATITDGTVVWTNQGTQVTVDGSAVWTFQGINSTNTLSQTPLLFDNTPPQSTYGDAFGPFQGSMIWTRDSAAPGYVYVSPPGRPEGVGQAYLVSSSNDPMQKVVEWDGIIWAISTQRAYQSNGSYPALSFPTVDDSLGTLQPYTVVAIKLIGIMYWAPDGIRILNWSGSVLIGFRELAPIFRSQSEENVPAWNETTGPVWAEEMRNEVIFSDGTTLTLGLTYDGTSAPVWRQPGQILTAGYYEHQTGEFQAAWGGNVYLFEHPGSLQDGSTPIPYEIQSPGDMPDSGAQFTGQRLYLNINPNVSSVPQVITPSLIVDGTVNALPAITATGRQMFELPISQYHGRLFEGVRLEGSLTGRIEVFRIEADVWLGEQQETND